jgi:hypothetical protein
MNRQWGYRAAFLLFHFVISATVVHFLSGRVGKKYTPLGCVAFSEHIGIADAAVVEKCLRTRFDIGIGTCQVCGAFALIRSGSRGDDSARVSDFHQWISLRRNSLSFSGNNLLNLGISRDEMYVGSYPKLNPFLHIASWSSAVIAQFDYHKYWFSIFKLQRRNVTNPEPRPLFSMEVLDGGLQTIRRILLGGRSRGVHFVSLGLKFSDRLSNALIDPLGTVREVLGSPKALSGRIRADSCSADELASLLCRATIVIDGSNPLSYSDDCHQSSNPYGNVALPLDSSERFELAFICFVGGFSAFIVAFFCSSSINRKRDGPSIWVPAAASFVGWPSVPWRWF